MNRKCKIIVVCILLVLVGFGGYFFWYRSKEEVVKEEIVANVNNEPKVEKEVEVPVVVPHPVSLPAYFNKSYMGSDFRVGKVLDNNSVYTRYYITYKSGELLISGIMNVPKATPPEGGYPLLLLNHGYIDPAIYTNGRGLRREQDYLVRQGFVVIHSDYRNHADSSKDKDADFNFRLGYVEDVINLVEAVKHANLAYVNADRVGTLGHSMGGGVTMNAITIKPDLVKAAVLYAPVSSNYFDNVDRWVNRENIYRPVRERIAKEYGTYDSNPEFWKGVSVRNYFSRIKAPIKIFHGTKDKDVPIEWSTQTEAALKAEGKNVDYVIYEGEGHEYSFKWTDFMQKTAAFFKNNL